MFAVRIQDPTAHPGLITGLGMPNVLIGGKPASVFGDIHTCSMPTPAGPHPPTTITKGSVMVLIGGRMAVRMLDFSTCGAPVIVGMPNVWIGG